MLQFSFFLISIITATTVVVADNDDDSAFMLNLLNSLKPPPSGWSSDTQFCKWDDKIKCDSSNRHVTSIDLSSRNLAGTLPSNLNSLTQLTILNLQNNNFSGPLPSLANLSSLTIAYLGNNQFNAVPPAAFSGLTSLQNLSISKNDFQPWTFPSELTQSSNLNYLDFDFANINGTLPDIFNNFTSLTELHLAYNNLIGELPNSLATSSIQKLWLNNNKFGLTGSIAVIANMTQLTQVWLHVNQFTGPIPDLTQCTNLYELLLRDNHLTGLVPVSLLNNMPSLQTVSLRNNDLQGPFPVFKNKNVKFEADGRNHFCLGNKTGPCNDMVMVMLQIAGGFGYPLKLAQSWTGNDPCQGSIAGIVIIVVLFVVAVLFVSWKCCSRKRLRKFARVSNPENGKGNVKLDLARVSNGYGGVPSELQSQSSGDYSQLHGFDGGSDVNPTISIDILRQVTNDFSDDNILGRGGFGIVYKGELPDGTKIAVKRMISVASGSKGLNEFEAEISVLTKVRHRHLVALMGYCINGNERLLVYEHMPQGTLTQHLYRKSDNQSGCLRVWGSFDGTDHRVLINKEDIPKAIDQTLDPDEETMLSIYEVAELAGHCTVREPYQRPDMGHAVNVLGPLVQLWKPTTQIDEGSYGVDNQTSLAEALRRWQAHEGTSMIFSDISSSQTQTSSKSPLFAGNFDSPDCR
ncbi:hypothetical protein TSUD_68660 [Trifolium subterraneum]|uniref:Protein kinase domain-containing protein n=1 Tax=Trifolium subterraneum TaxID=3900 RepID=A0A2Z6NT37_TRISU|nr:hypothetical protein TSUD_68660 [Trifolium subterraneum]